MDSPEPFVAHQAPVLGPAGLKQTAEVCERLARDRYRVLGREFTLPMHIADFSLLGQVFAVPAKAARALLEPTGLRAAEILPGTSAVSLLAVEYRENPLGDYREAAILLPAYAPGTRGLPLLGGLDVLLRRAGHYVHAMPVDQELTTHAGRCLWGYPKFLAELAIGYGERTAQARFAHEGELVFAMQTPLSETGSLTQRVQTFTRYGGKLRRIEPLMHAQGVAFRLGGARPEIGERHPLAKQLRALGLPKTPLCSLSVRRANADFGIAREL